MSDIKKYNDIMVRDYRGEDTGIVQRVTAISLDIIPYGQDILYLDTATAQYDSYLYDSVHAVIADKQCNCYVRARNIATQGESSGTVQLFLMPFNVFTNPERWTKLQTYNSSNGKYETKSPLVSKVPMYENSKEKYTEKIGPGMVCINKNAFILSDNYEIKVGVHYCLCAVVETPKHQITIPSSFKNNLEVDKWTMDNPNVALLNIYPVDFGMKYIDYSFEFGNYGTVAESFMLKVSFLAEYEEGERWPIDTKVRLQCTDIRYSFDFKDMNVPAYNPSTQANPSVTIAIENVPAGFYGVASTYLSTTQSFPKHAAIRGEYYIVTNGIPKGYENMRERFIHAPELEAKHGKNAYLLRLGECYTYNMKMSAQKLYEMIDRSNLENPRP